MSELVFENVTKAFGKKPVLQGLSARVPMKGITFVVGRSGSGKSVLCRLAVGLLRPESGTVHCMGQEVSALSEEALNALRAQTPYIVQGPALLDGLTVEENVALPGRFLTADECRRRTQEALEQLGLDAWKARYPHMLGPALKKRVAIARALVLKPHWLLLDEPTTGLDQKACQQVNEAIASLKALGLGALVVSHDYEALRQLADHILVIGRGQRVFWGTQKEFLQSQHPEVVSLRDPETASASDV